MFMVRPILRARADESSREILVVYEKGSPSMRAQVPLRSLGWALLGCVAFATAGNAVEPTATPPKDIRQGLFAACFTSPTDGWIGGDLGRLYRTKDGGKTWLRYPITEDRRPFFSIACLGEQVWVSTTHARVHHSADGGATWQELKAPGDRNLLSIGFVNERRGIGVGDFGLLVRTEDGGATWEEITLPETLKLPETANEMGVFPGDILLYSISFVDENTAWIAGEFG